MGLFDLLSSATEAYEPVECQIRIDGSEIARLYPYLREVVVEMSRSAADTCKISFDSRRDEQGEWLVQDSELFYPWSKLEIDAWFGRSAETIITGYIRNVQADYPAAMAQAGVVVTGQDESLLLDRDQVRRTWSSPENPLADGQIARQIGSQAGFSVAAEPGITTPGLYQNATDIRFLKERATANGFEFYVRNGRVYFGPIDLNSQPQAPILVYGGSATNCISCSIKHEGHLPDQIQVSRAVEQGTGKQTITLSPNLTILGRKSASSDSLGLNPFVWSMPTPRGATFEEVRARAQAKANETAFKIVAEGELDGALYRHALLTYHTVLLDGLGKVYSGLYYVDQVTHTFSREGYRQKFRLIRNATGETGF